MLDTLTYVRTSNFDKHKMNWHLSLMTADTGIQKKTRYHHGDLKAQLIEATRQLVEENGPDHFSVSQACRVAGVSTAAPYRHFKDRDEMLMAVMREGMKRHYDQMVASLEGIQEGSVDRIVALGQVYVAFAQKEPGIFRLIFGRKGERAKEEMFEDGAACYALLEHEVMAALGLSEIDAKVKHRAFMLWTFVHGLSFLLIDEKLSVEEMVMDTESLLNDLARRVLA